MPETFFFTLQMRTRWFWLAKSSCFLSSTAFRCYVLKVMWKMVCVNSFQVGPGFGEQGCISPWRFPRTTLLLHLRESPPPPCIPTFQKISLLSFCQVLPSWSCWDWVIFKPFDCKWRLNCCSDWTCEVHLLPVAWQNFIYWIVLLYF